MVQLKKIAAGVCTIALICSALAGCGPKDASKSEKNDTVIFSQGADPKKIDPAYASDGESSKVICNTFEPLVKFPAGSTENVEPCLAEKWEISPDGLTYTFSLRKGVLFHDETPFNAEAVKINIDRMMDPAGEKPYTDNFSAVEGVTVKDESTVEIKLKEPYTPFLKNLAMVLGGAMVSPAALEKRNGDVSTDPTGAGTGPYKFKKWEKGQTVVLERNDKYWGDKAKIKNLIFKIIPDTSARVLALKNGDIDIMDGVDPNVKEQLTSSGMKIFEIAAQSINFLAFAMDVPPFDNPEARKAVAQAIDVKKMVADLYKGSDKVAHGIFPPTVPGHDPSIELPSYDPDAAKQTFSELKIKEATILAYTNQRPYNSVGGKVLAEAIQSALRQVGVELNIIPLSWGAHLGRVPKRDFRMCVLGWLWDNGDPHNFAQLFADHKNFLNNPSAYNNPDYDALMTKGVTLPDGDERTAIYKKGDQLIAKDLPILPISNSSLQAAHRPNIQGFAVHPTGNIYFAGVSKS
jgi:peptide/nickel transport system substrate-binding protein